MPSRTRDLGSQFTCWWVSLHSYGLLPQTLHWQPNLFYFRDSKPSFHLLSDFSSPSFFLSLFPPSNPLTIRLPSPFIVSPLWGSNDYFFIISHVIPLLLGITKKNRSLWGFSWNLFYTPNSVWQQTSQRH